MWSIAFTGFLWSLHIVDQKNKKKKESACHACYKFTVENDYIRFYLFKIITLKALIFWQIILRSTWFIYIFFL